MPAYSTILRALTVEKFSEVLGASPRKSREVYFHRHSVRAPQKATRMPKPGAKNELRTQALYEVLQAEDDDQLAEEILRSWLLTKRAMLAGALDHLGIAHKDGLTESDEVSRFEKLDTKATKALLKALEGVAPKEEVVVYLKFMGVPDVDKACG
jgi:hypothetical protein